jgi:hypothetical protein
MTDSDLWDGVEDGENATATPSGEVGQPICTDLRAQLWGAISHWLTHLTYREIHAVILGFGPTYWAITLLAFPVLPGWLSVAGLTGAFLLAAVAVTGLPSGNAIVTEMLGNEPHYYLAGMSSGVLVGSLTLTLILLSRAVLGVVG